jgi:lambda family phage tail tape measure protein
MAKKIEELVVELGIKGLEGLDNLSSSFRNLQKAIGPSDNAITQVRKSILDMSSAGKQSIQMIQGQIDAFKGLQAQATIGSNVYRQLAGDVNRLSDTLRGLRGDYEEVGRVARQTDAQIANQFPARRPEAFRVQLAALNRELGQLSVSARAYGDALTEITIRETAFGRAQARQGAIAGAQAVGAPLIAAMTPQQALPNTTAALRVQLAELTQDFDNLDRSGEQYAEVAQRISEIQEELSRNILGVATAYDRHAAAENAAIRRAEKMRGIQEYYRGRGAATGFRDPSSGAIIAGGAPGTSQPLPIERPMREISGLFQQIGQIGMQPIISNIEMMGSSYEQVAASIKGATAASNGSISSLQAQRGAWQQLRAQLDPASVGFKQAGREIEQLDRRLEKFQSRRRQPLGAMGATQAAGAVISGGIFGGPEGAIGGAIGTAMGGVPGAFAGAAIGAQVGSIRQSLGAMAEFTAEIDKQRIALRNVVGSQEQYNNSLQFIDATSRRMAIPQDQLNKQFTQLAASVIGAGGNVDAAKVAFEGIAAGIRGTGGSLQDMDSALRATAQVFSKGKVSAEELRQQIGERLPGAFTLFAQSIGKTPQELDKMLQKGEVSLNDFMTFVQALTARYGSSAAEIAASSQAAGDRMQVTFARLREAIGRELQPIGAQFQELIARVLAENEQQIIQFAKGIADAASAIAGFLTTAGPAIVEIAKLAVQFAAASLAIKVFTALQGPAQTMFLALQNGFTATTAQAAAAQTRMIAFGTTVKAIAASLAAPIIVTVAIIGAGIVIKTLNDIKAARDRLAQQATLPRGEQFIQSIGGSAASYETLVRNANDVAKALDIEERNLKTLRERSAQRQTSTYSGLNQENKTLKTQIDATEKSITRLKINYRALIDAIPGAQKASQAELDFSFPTGDLAGAAGGAKGAKGPESRAAELRLDLHLREQMFEAESMIAQARLDGDERLAAMLVTLQAQTRLVTEAAKVEFDKIPAQDKALKLRILEQDSQQESAKLVFVLAELEKKATDELKKSIEQISKQVDEFKNRAAFEREYGELIMQGTLPAIARQYLETKKVVDETIRAAEAALAKAEADGAAADEIERQRKELERIRGAGQEELGRIQGGGDPSSVISAAITRIKGELNELLNLGNQVVGAATAIGDAFGNSFKGLISGSMSAKEALRSFFQSTADYFLDMAAKIIAKQITMFILNTLLGFVGGGGGGGGLGQAAQGISFNPGAFSMPRLAADGATFANGAAKFAKGGVVNRPTMFKFANGGAMQTGVMGEAGPEAIMPLKRGADGKLGVQATGLREAMGAAPGSSAASPVLNMSFESTTIGGVEYVSRDQLEQAMAETRRAASRDGAQRGMTMTLDRIQNSSSTRRRVGI